MTELGLIFGSAVLGLAFAAYLARWVARRSAGDPQTARAGALVRKAAEGFLRRQNSTIGAIAALLGGAIFLAYGLLRGVDRGDPVPALELGVWLTLSFAVGTAACIAASEVAVWVATSTGPRAASGARRSLDDALQIAMRGGAVTGIFVSSVSLLGLAALLAAVLGYKGAFGADPRPALQLAPSIPLMIVGYALGAGFTALLGQLGGGAFAKAADVGADLVALEAGLGEDAARNPVTLADLVGDAVGGAAGGATAVFASTIAENLGAMLAGAAVAAANRGIASAIPFMAFPLVTRGFGVVATAFGVVVVRTDDREDPLSALARGLYVVAILHAAGAAGAAKWLLGAHWVSFFAAALVGVATAVALFHVTSYFVEGRHRPVREIAEASRSGATLTVLHGLATGIEGAIAPLVVLVAAALAATAIGARTGLAGGGLFGVAAALMGYVGTSGFVLAMDGFGPILDGASGIVEMTVAADRPDVRGRATVLDAVGNTVKTFTKAHAAGAALLGALLLVSAYLDEVRRRVAASGAGLGRAARLDSPELAAGALIGLLLVAWVASRAILAVARATRRVLDEARRQLRHGEGSGPTAGEGRAGGQERDSRGGLAGAGREAIPGRIEGPPDAEACVELVARVALRSMIAPAVVSVVVPAFVGMALRFARSNDNPLIAADAVAALVLGATVVGSFAVLLLGHAGGAWDNAKKYVATGAHGGRYLVDERGARVDNPTYVAALLADTVGDTLKDAVAPAIHVLVKMLPAVTLVFLPFFV